MMLKKSEAWIGFAKSGRPVICAIKRTDTTGMIKKCALQISFCENNGMNAIYFSQACEDDANM
jgi:hypothetical protein